MLINALLITIIIVQTLKLLFDFYSITISKQVISKPFKEEKIDFPLKILILIPVLREQNIIHHTLTHFENIQLSSLELIICIVGTKRELKNNPENSIFTSQIVTDWINQRNIKTDSIKFIYCEEDKATGDRATQLNFAVNEVTKSFTPDIIGVYDADSLPDKNTLLEVAILFYKNPYAVFQQPVHFINATNKMVKEKKNLIVIANALYQTTWTVIRELPRWYSHSLFYEKNTGKTYLRNNYLIGHGEFIPYSIYCKYIFPENEVTDGIQLGYRLSMTGIKIIPLHTFCSDDVPQQITQIILQHKRWFGGCNRLIKAHKWSMKNIGKSSITQVIDGYWSQLSWAYAAIFSIFGLILSIFKAHNGNFYYLSIESILLFLHCYIIPFIAHRLFPIKANIPFINWLALPLAIGIKAIGPNLYFITRLQSLITKEKISYSKVER